MKLTDLCEIRSGFSFPQKPVVNPMGDYLVLGSEAVNASGLIDVDQLKRVSSSQFPKPSIRLKPGDVLIRGKGSSHNALLYSLDDYSDKVVPTSYFLILRLKDENVCCPAFLSWILNQPEYQEKLHNLSGGATVQHLTKKRLSALELEIPKKEKQKMLLELDDKIRSENQLIEEIRELRMARYQHEIKRYLGT